MRVTKTFVKTEFGRQFGSEAYTEDGGKTWRWESNNAVITIGTCKEYSIPCDVLSQQKAYSEYVAQVIADYRREREKNGYSEEERMEARAAHGPGVELVDILTGRKFTT